jgi:hypothetical protein
MKDMKALKTKLHVLHGDFLFFVVSEGHDRYSIIRAKAGENS